ncbi:hypothetical protein ACFC14_05850 [Microbacterium sp. NPDC055988]|uniref:hypothetical protein n=1 Tax=Microbacterium sp. NPDC055988 TaxID=3345671 RepID=UPI0035DE5A15
MKTSTIRGWGFVAIGLAAIGSVTSYSVVRAGGMDGATYLIVNIALAVTGVVLLGLAARGRSKRN